MRRALAVIVLAVGLAGCPKGAYHDAVVAEHDAKATVMAFQQAETSAFQAGQISPEEHRAIEAQVEKVGLAGQALTNALQAGAAQTSVLADLNVLTQAVGDLGSTGVLGLKNETSKAALQAAVTAIKAVLFNLQTILAAQKAVTP